jgi:hypothetical protein
MYTLPLSSFSLTWGGGEYFHYPVRFLLVFATRPKSELDGCDVALGESLLVLLLHAYQYLLFGDILRDVVHYHPWVFPFRSACFQTGFF